MKCCQTSPAEDFIRIMKELPKEYQLRFSKYNYPTGIVFLRTNESQQFKVFVTQHEVAYQLWMGDICEPY
ncbi:hypothetical protein E3N88_10652 [Mikania micrantha]|uniref:Uncharacterized protein n=1 Tax=Mikania micrantha TaxID=192012 RepID=A0A5N6PB42_9ASTR|nr:hypothetical protein E3N88_10652 [Mikania micrantha]